VAILDTTGEGADTGQGMARANLNAVRGIYDEGARRGSVSPVEVYAEDSVQVLVFDDRQETLEVVGRRVLLSMPESATPGGPPNETQVTRAGSERPVPR
jgi:hypothetical protein